MNTVHETACDRYAAGLDFGPTDDDDEATVEMPAFLAPDVYEDEAPELDECWWIDAPEADTEADAHGSRE